VSMGPDASSISETGSPLLAIKQTSMLDISDANLSAGRARAAKRHAHRRRTASVGPATPDIGLTTPVLHARRITSSRSARSGERQGTTPSQERETSSRGPRDGQKGLAHKSGNDRALAEMKERSAQAGEPAEGDIEGP
jgi:hypothetical protein